MVPFPAARSLAVAAVASGLALAGCDGGAPPPPAPPAAPVTLPPPTLPRPPPPLGRAELLGALDEAASAFASGSPGPATDVAGRRFTIRQAFGCSPPPPGQPAGGLDDGQARLLRRPGGDTLELNLRPADWIDAPMIAGAGAAWEAVEGFWLQWPWMRADGCPAPAQAEAPQPAAAAPAAAAPATPTVAAAPVTAPLAPPPQTAGLAAVFAHGSSRLAQRDGRAFRHLIRGEAAAQPAAAGYRLVLEGRFAAFPDGRAIRCAAPAPQARPVCVAAAEIDRIAFESAEGELLSEWRRG